MTVVIDSNALIVLVSNDPRKPAVERQIEQWMRDGEILHAPTLVWYELANGLTRLIAAGNPGGGDLHFAWSTAEALPIITHPDVVGPEVVTIAVQLRRQNAYDAVYLAFTLQMNAELWTLDGPLCRNAVALGFPIHLITS